MFIKLFWLLNCFFVLFVVNCMMMTTMMMPLSNVGNKMDNATVRIATGLRLGAPIVRSWRFGSGHHSRRNQINDVLCRAFIKSCTLATRESHSLCPVSEHCLFFEQWHPKENKSSCADYRTFWEAALRFCGNQFREVLGPENVNIWKRVHNVLILIIIILFLLFLLFLLIF